MAAAYVLGMAVTYSALGVAASLTQGIFGAALQHPLVLLGLGGSHGGDGSFDVRTL